MILTQITKKLLSAMALGVRAFKDPNKNDENNNFDENDKKWLSAMTRTSKDLNENDENHNFDKKKNYKKVNECNEMKGYKVELLE